jgi:outer membrane protein TolC
LKNYPSIRVSEEQLNAAAASIALARSAYLPRVDLLGQVNRATRNNLFGMLLPQGVIPSISGPVLGTNNFGTAWGSAAGALVSWEPFDFGGRAAAVRAADAGRAARQATVNRTRFDVSVAAADAFVTLVATEAAARVADAGVDRAAVIARTTEALVRGQLRPGADQSRAEAELAAARIQLTRAEQAVDVARANLAQFIGPHPEGLSIIKGRLTSEPPNVPATPLRVEFTPAAKEQSAVVAQMRAQLSVLERSYFPRFQLQAAAYGRGSGAEVNGAIQGGANGLAPNTQDYALGFTATFPVFDFASLHAREAEQAANVRAETARYQQIARDLQTRWNTAVANLNGARGIAQNLPAELNAAKAATDQARARYQAGLGIIDDVAEAERLLTQTEIDDALARLSVWRALLEVAAAAGDIQPFLAEVGR